MDQPHRHNQNSVGANGHSPLLWSTEMKTPIKKNVTNSKSDKQILSEMSLMTKKMIYDLKNSIDIIFV